MSDNMPDVKLHKCNFYSESRIYGPAVDVCFEQDDGSLWVGNGEYSSRINFCPFCGYKARTQARLEKPMYDEE